MVLLENQLTQENVERARNNPELEKLSETEHKLTPTNPELLESLFRAEAYPVTQHYLSTPFDEASLRVRAAYKPAGTEYSSSQKDRGEIRGNALRRHEINTPISRQAYDFYEGLHLPTVHKFRTEVMDGVTVDFYDDPVEPIVVEVESEDPEVRAYLLHVMQDMVGGCLVDRSDDPSLTNEAIAYRNVSMESLKAPESLDAFVDRIVAEAVGHYVSGKHQVVTSLDGLPGSGKSTVTRAFQERIVELYGEHMRPIALSTDDYHFGKTALEAQHGAPYTDWDAGRTYNTPELADDIACLAEGVAIQRRHFDFETQEPVFDDFVEPSPFIIIEGVQAGSVDLNDVRDLHFELPTSIATSVLRDTRRLAIDGRANEAFPTPQDRFRHQIENVVPNHLERAQPPRKAFSASTRPLASRAFMLAQLSR